MKCNDQGQEQYYGQIENVMFCIPHNKRKRKKGKKILNGFNFEACIVSVLYFLSLLTLLSVGIMVSSAEAAEG